MKIMVQVQITLNEIKALVVDDLRKKGIDVHVADLQLTHDGQYDEEKFSGFAVEVEMTGGKVPVEPIMKSRQSA